MCETISGWLNSSVQGDPQIGGSEKQSVLEKTEGETTTGKSASLSGKVITIMW